MDVLKITYNQLDTIHQWVKDNYQVNYFLEGDNNRVHPRSVAWLSPGHYIVGLDKLKRHYPLIQEDSTMQTLFSNNTVDYSTLIFPES
jgi:hypothetical protein